jgi:hypothetical protein
MLASPAYSRSRFPHQIRPVSGDAGATGESTGSRSLTLWAAVPTMGGSASIQESRPKLWLALDLVPPRAARRLGGWAARWSLAPEGAVGCLAGADTAEPEAWGPGVDDASTTLRPDLDFRSESRKGLRTTQGRLRSEKAEGVTEQAFQPGGRGLDGRFGRVAFMAPIANGGWR